LLYRPLLLVNGNRVTLSELVKLPMVVREEGSGTRREAEKFLARKGISLGSLKITGICGSTDAVKQAVRAGLGISILSRFSVSDELQHKILKTLELPGVEIMRWFYIVTHKKRILPRLYDKFLEHLLTGTKNL
jgi:DNA-binding transcriptional LysR family regulator